MGDILERICNCILCILLTIIGVFIFARFCIPLMDKMVNIYETIGPFKYSSFKELVLGIGEMTFIIFYIAFFAMAILCFAAKAIYNLWLFFYYLLFYNNNYDKIQINVNDENQIIDSYLEFRNGDRLPLYINKIVGKEIKEQPDDSNQDEEK